VPVPPWWGPASRRDRGEHGVYLLVDERPCLAAGSIQHVDRHPRPSRSVTPGRCPLLIALLDQRQSVENDCAQPGDLIDGEMCLNGRTSLVLRERSGARSARGQRPFGRECALVGDAAGEREQGRHSTRRPDAFVPTTPSMPRSPEDEMNLVTSVRRSETVRRLYLQHTRPTGFAACPAVGR